MERKSLMNAKSQLSIRAQADLLEVDRSSFYYKPIGETQENLKLMRKIDELFLDDPTLGVLGMQDALSDFSLAYNHKRIRRLMRKMSLDPIYPKRNLSKLGLAKYIHPYLLRNLAITQPNQVWAIDITYIPMKSDLMYPKAIFDVYSRLIVG
jgi:putative transposase